jgi:hypothetical protein
MNIFLPKEPLKPIAVLILLIHCVSLWAQQGTPINAGMAGSWANPEIPGQGIFTDIDPSSRTVFMAWFTYGDTPVDAESVIGAPSNRWYVAVGEYSEGSNSVELALSETDGGIFDNPAPVTEEDIGQINLSFLSCSEVEMEFDFDNGGPQGQIELTRLTSSEVCETLTTR